MKAVKTTSSTTLEELEKAMAKLRPGPWITGIVCNDEDLAHLMAATDLTIDENLRFSTLGISVGTSRSVPRGKVLKYYGADGHRWVERTVKELMASPELLDR